MIVDEEPQGVTATMILITKKDITVPVTVQTRTALPPDRAFQPAISRSCSRVGGLPRGVREPDRSMGSRRRGKTDLDQSVLVLLIKSGSNLSKPHKIELFLYFPAQSVAEKAGPTSEM